METHIHQFEPVYNQNSHILILGTFPSIKSRETHFYYGHPQNRFWKVLAAILKSPISSSIEEKKAFLLGHSIAVWDVIKSCDIHGSSDISIRNVIPNDITRITLSAPITHIYANGQKAYDLFLRYCANPSSLPITKLPSTSPANASYSLERLTKEWCCIQKNVPEAFHASGTSQ